LLCANLGEMAAFTIDPATNKRFFHVEGASVFRAGAETIGSADARISLMVDAPVPAPVPEPEPGSLLLGAGLLGAAAARRKRAWVNQDGAAPLPNADKKHQPVRLVFSFAPCPARACR
jgi:hypothetical protein